MRNLAFFVIVFFTASLASADTLTLKNGTSVHGIIVEQTDDVIKMDTGIGVNTTYYSDEIEAIEMTTGANKTPQVPMDGPSSTYLKLQEAVQSKNFPEIKKYITQKKAKEIEDSNKINGALEDLQGVAPKDLKIINEDISGEEAVLTVQGTVWKNAAKGTVNLRKKDHKWVVEKENWKVSLPEETPAVNERALSTEKGSIEGIVRLPETDKKGDLFISFVPAGQILQGPDTLQRFLVVPKEEISSQEIPFSLEDCPPGDYWGFATWDVAQPFWEPSWGEGNCPGYSGDFVGGTKETVTVQPSEVSQTTISCTRQL